MRTMAFKGYCICLQCNNRIKHKRGTPCKEVTCPECGKKMIREDSYHHQLYKEKKGKK